MKRGTRRAMLFLSLALLAGAWLVTAYMAQLDAAEAEPADAESAGYDLSIGTQKEITALSWAWEGRTVNLRRNAQGRWENADDAGCPIDNAAAGALARAAASVTASMAIDGVTELAQYGLDDPQLVVMAAAGDAIVSYELGNGSITGEYYMRVDGGDTVYLENGGLPAAFRKDLTELLDTESLPGDIAAVTGLSVTTEAQSYELRLAPDGRWLRTDGGEERELEPGPVRSLYELLLATDLTDCVGWDEGADRGFGEPQGVVTLDYMSEAGTEKSFTLEFGDYDGRDVFVRFAGSELVYRTSAAALDALMYPSWDTMLPQPVLSFDAERIDTLVIGRNGTEYEVICLREAEDAETVYSMNGWVLDTKAVDGWLASVAGLEAEGTAQEKQGRGELFSLRLVMKPETEEDEEEPGPEELSLSLWQYDSVHALCVTDGRSLLVPKQEALSISARLDEIIAAE
mgnify:CR=1 FL=1